MAPKTISSIQKLQRKALQRWYLAGKCPRVLVLKINSVQFSIQPFLLQCDAVVILLRELLSFFRRHFHTKFVDIVILNFHYFSKIKLKSSAFMRKKELVFRVPCFGDCVNPGYIYWTKSQTFSLAILDYLSVDTY